MYNANKSLENDTKKKHAKKQTPNKLTEKEKLRKIAEDDAYRAFILSLIGIFILPIILIPIALIFYLLGKKACKKAGIDEYEISELRYTKIILIAIGIITALTLAFIVFYVSILSGSNTTETYSTPY